MPVGKAKAASAANAGEEFRVEVPCFTQIDEASIRDELAHDHFFWLDLTALSADDLAKLRELFGFHPLALEDAEHFGQRPKLDNFGDYIFMVFYGAWRHGDDDVKPLREVHLFISGHYLVTIHRDPLPPATIFLPLSFITGFFGQNFGYLVSDLIMAPWTFWVLGVGSMLATCFVLLRFFRRKGWV